MRLRSSSFMSLNGGALRRALPGMYIFQCNKNCTTVDRSTVPLWGDDRHDSVLQSARYLYMRLHPHTQCTKACTSCTYISCGGTLFVHREELDGWIPFIFLLNRVNKWENKQKNLRAFNVSRITDPLISQISVVPIRACLLSFFISSGALSLSARQCELSN